MPTNIDVHLVVHMAGETANVTVKKDTGNAADLPKQIAAPFPPDLKPFLDLVGPKTIDTTTVTVDKVRKYLKGQVKNNVPGFWDVKNTPDIKNHVWKLERWVPKSTTPGDFGWAFRIQDYRVASNTYDDFTRTRKVEDAGGTEQVLKVYYYMVVQKRG